MAFTPPVLSPDLETFSRAHFGEEYERFINGLSERIRTKIRLSDLKMPAEETLIRLKEDGLQVFREPWYSHACQYDPPTAFPGQTLSHHLGHIYLQDFSSMLPVLVLDPKPGERVLDLAAAPGSKSTQLAQHMQNRGTLISNDIEPGRLANLIFNLDRVGAVNVQVTGLPGEQIGNLLPGYFDKVLIDAPCSALGVIHNKQEVAGWWTFQRMKQFAGLQEKLLISALKACKPGGIIVYSTCTLTTEENEAILASVLSRHPGELQEANLPTAFSARNGGIPATDTSIPVQLSKRIYPMDNDFRCQGFFLAKIMKTGERVSPTPRMVPQNRIKPSLEADLKQRMSDYFGMSPDWLARFGMVESGDVWAVSEDMIQPGLPGVRRTGMRMGRWMGKQLKMTTDFLQLAGPQITRKRYDITDPADFRSFMAGSPVPNHPGETGQVAVFYRNCCLGSGLAQGGQIKSQIPTAKRYLPGNMKPGRDSESDIG